ncbi:hypothetical protein [Paenibacillus flagellatus]|uniref:Uncharacterized protein n=1 Tax=Paenibacillus flagellatus TaxID=2211139 RepID=A0A2V5KMC1_9BACL|nr:hypothetical protein [Paenibacillus flagellatus]PYI52047.1 hypothetical protein DLM86_21410 [Paenibacillus flagellatus]
MHPYLAPCRIVELINPYEQWRDPLVRELFEKTTTLKFESYRKKYPAGVIPTDAVSWFCDHLLVCREHGGRLQPILGFQRATMERYRRHYHPFTPLAMCEGARDSRHITAMKKLAAQFAGHPHLLSYTGSFAVAPGFRTDRTLTEELVRLMVVLHYFVHREAGEGHEIVTGPTIRSGLDTLLLDFGFFPLVEPKDEHDKAALPVSSFDGEEVRIVRCREFNRDLVQLAEPYRSMWANRLVLHGHTGLEGMPGESLVRAHG